MRRRSTLLRRGQRSLQGPRPLLQRRAAFRKCAHAEIQVAQPKASAVSKQIEFAALPANHASALATFAATLFRVAVESFFKAMSK
jgi:hypothetical protein